MTQTIQMHDLEPTTYFEEIKGENEVFAREALKILEEPTSDHQFGLFRLMGFRYQAGCLALLLGSDTRQASAFFVDSAAYGVRMLRLSARSSPNERPLAIDKFIEAMLRISAFGDAAAHELVASVPEDTYTSNPNVVPEEGVLSELRAHRAWLRSDFKLAQQAAELAVEETTNQRVIPAIKGLLAVIAGDKAKFEECLQAVVQKHKAFFKKSPHLAEGVVSLPALILCRMGLDRGFSIEERPYMPIHCLPNFEKS